MDAAGKSPFKKPRCCECGAELAAQQARYEYSHRLYCAQCQPLARVKEQWQPLGAGVVSKIFVLPPTKKTVL